MSLFRREPPPLPRPPQRRRRQQAHSLPHRLGGWLSGPLPRLYRQQPAFQFLPDMRGNRLAGEVLRGQAGDKLAGHVEEAAESGFAKERAVEIEAAGPTVTRSFSEMAA